MLHDAVGCVRGRGARGVSQTNASANAILMRVLNLTRIIDVIYKEEDGYTHADVILIDHSVSSLLIDPVPI